MKSSIFLGKVMHKRLLPKVHFLKYRFFQVMIDLQKPLKTRLFSINNFNIFSFYEKDHGPDKWKNDRPLLTRVREFLSEKEIYGDGDEIYLLTMPRFFGFAFNPISIYFVYEKNGSLKSVAYEVNNTFGSRHTYVASIDETFPTHEKNKQLHVSPFMDMEMFYKFRTKMENDELRLQILLFDKAKGLYLIASQKSHAVDLNDANLFKVAVSMPFMTIGVVFGIHWHALKILLKGIKYRHPPNRKSKSTY